MKQVDVQRRFQLRLADLGRLWLLAGTLAVLLLCLPNNLYCPANRRIILTLGVLGLWRYSWWLVHFVRSQIYARYIFPPLRRRAEALWQSGWRPKRVLYMITTFKEVRSTTEKLVEALLNEVRSTGIPARVFFGTGDDRDEQIIATYLRRHARGIDLDMIFVRQNLPGRRIAIGLVLRAMSRYGVRDDDLVVFMDGNTYPEPGLLRKCLPLFALCPELDALTTDERSIIIGPSWMQWWIDMRLAQRQLAMQSIALAGKLLTLTGRCSFFRARYVVQESFIRLVEADYLDSWLWGRFRFLSGDDKSTAYALLSQPEGTVLRYVPDALATTIEYVEGGWVHPRPPEPVGLVGEPAAQRPALHRPGPGTTRLVYLVVFYRPADRHVDDADRGGDGPHAGGPARPVDASGGRRHGAAHPVRAVAIFVVLCRANLYLLRMVLYFNQVTNAAVKVYLLFRLAKQRWRNWGDQRVAEGQGWLPAFQNMMGTYLTSLCLAVFAFTLFTVFLLDGFPRLPLVLHVLGWR